MTTVIIHLLAVERMMDLYTGINNPGQATTARQLFEQGYYTPVSIVVTRDLSGEDVADEVFDLTNNPSRQPQREQQYGRGRSLSVGDIVETDVGRFVCCSMGWAQLA